MRAHLDETPYAVILSATEGYKTLKVHSPSSVVSDWEYLPSPRKQWEQKYPSVSSILNIEGNFTCIEFRIGQEAYRSYYHSTESFPLDILYGGCPMITRLTIELDEFRGISKGWDWCYCEFARRSPKRIPLRSAYNEAAIASIARFANLRDVTTHFFISEREMSVMGPRQERQAAFELYKRIERQKCGVRLDRLDVVFHTCVLPEWGILPAKDVKPPVTMAVRPLEKPKGDCRYSVTCDDTRPGEFLCRTTIPLGLGELVLRSGCPCPTLVRLKESRNEMAGWPFGVDTLEYE